MEVLRAICLVMACSLVLVESIRRDLEDCRILLHCGSGITEFILTQEGALSYFSLADEENLDKFCEITEDANDCFSSLKSSCDDTDVVANVQSIVSGANYICSEEGRRATLALADSECATNEQKALEVDESVLACVQSFQNDVLLLSVSALSSQKQLDPSELCPFVDSLTECVAAVSAYHCGDEFGDFIEGVLKHTEDSRIDDLGCNAGFEGKRFFLRNAPYRRRRSPSKRG